MINVSFVLLVLLLLAVLLFIGIPVGFSLFISGFFGLGLFMGFERAISMTTGIVESELSSFLLATIPMFILMAFILNESGVVSDLFKFFNHWVGHYRGGLAVATTIANGGMAALSGSSTANAAAMSTISFPEMKKYNYSDSLALGTVAAAGTFAAMFPPSLALIIYGVFTQTSIADLFIAGIIPGMLTLIGYIGIIYLWGFLDPTAIGGIQDNSSWGEKINSLKYVLPAGILVVIVIGSLYAGIVTPSESGALGVIGALIIGRFVYNMGADDIITAHYKALEITTMVFLILIGATIFSRYITLEQVAQRFIDLLISAPLPVVVLILLLLFVYVIMGTFMDQIAILVLTLPFTFPFFVDTLGYSPIWFGLVIVKTIEIGLITPPLGLNVYVASGPVDVDIKDAFSGAMRFLVVDIIVIGLLLLFPDLFLILV